VGVNGPFDVPTVFLRFLYSFKETDFLADVGVEEDIGGGGDFRDCLLGGVSLRGFPWDGGVASRLRLVAVVSFVGLC
jgi:hypothetical protein